MFWTSPSSASTSCMYMYICVTVCYYRTHCLSFTLGKAEKKRSYVKQDSLYWEHRIFHAHMRPHMDDELWNLPFLLDSNIHNFLLHFLLAKAFLKPCCVWLCVHACCFMSQKYVSLPGCVCVCCTNSCYIYFIGQGIFRSHVECAYVHVWYMSWNHLSHSQEAPCLWTFPFLLAYSFLIHFLLAKAFLKAMLHVSVRTCVLFYVMETCVCFWM